jgi:hypothetical protein
MTPTAWRALLTWARQQGLLTAEQAIVEETAVRQWETQQHNREQHDTP